LKNTSTVNLKVWNKTLLWHIQNLSIHELQTETNLLYLLLQKRSSFGMATKLRFPAVGLTLRDFVRPRWEWCHAFISARANRYSIGVPSAVEWSRASMMDVYDYKF
jgi:hypothetical protein